MYSVFVRLLRSLDLKRTEGCLQTIGPLFPTSRYTLLNSFLISVGCYAGIGVIATIFIFPSTMSHDTLHAIDRLFTKITALIEVQEEVFATSPKDLASGSALSSRIVGDRSAAIAGIQQSMCGI